MLNPILAAGVMASSSVYGGGLIPYGPEVFRVDGPGGEHFFYNSMESGEEVIWLTVEAADALPILEEALKTF